MKNISKAAILVSAGAVAFSAGVASADLTAYSQDFEGLDATSASALGDDNWVVFANVFNPAGDTFLYGYGVFPAPNGSGAFSNVAVGEGGPAQGAQQLVTFSDYNNPDHGVGNIIETNVFQEQTVGASNVGETWTFSFDSKLGDIGGSSTAGAFIKTLDPNAGFALTNFISQDTTNTPATWTGYSLDITIDASLVGQIFQIGFITTASNFESSGVFYDNVNFVPAPSAAALLALGGLVGARRRR